MEYNKVYERISERILSFRNMCADNTQDALIDLLQEHHAGVGRNTLSKLENGAKVKLTLDTCLALCEIMDCDLDYLMGVNNCKTKDAQGVADYTGLPEEAVDTLHKLASDAGAFLLIEDLLTSPDLLRELGRAYYTHWFSFHAVQPLLEKELKSHDEEVRHAAKRMKMRFQIDGGDLPAVPAEEAVDYTRFQLQRAIVHFTERQASPSWLARMEAANKTEKKDGVDDYRVEG